MEVSYERRTMKSRTGLGFLLLIVIALTSPIGFGQAGRGSINGTVFDNTGALVPNAKVQVQDTATQATRVVTTGATGLYSVSALVPGTYRVTVSVDGFQSATAQNLPVTVDRTTTFDFKLQLAGVVQTVNVSATDRALLNTVDSTESLTIDNKQITGLPLNSRNVLMLTQLSQGVVPANGALNNTGEFNRPGLGVSAFHINGLPEGGLFYMLDGTPLTVLGFGSGVTSPAFYPTMENVSEFRLETNNGSATTPSSGAGVLDLVSKSGTNKLHGSVFYFPRPNALDANDPFQKAAQLAQGKANTPAGFSRNQEGGSIGGPIRKNKLFYFGDYERTRSTSTASLTTTVPTQAERGGDFSDVPTIYNPFNISSSGARQPFAGNQIPSSLWDPVAVAMNKYEPLPNASGTGAYHVNNYVDSSPSPNNADKFNVRIDNYLTEKQTFFGRYSYSRIEFGSPDHSHTGADASGQYLNFTNSQQALLGYNYAISPHRLLQMRYSFLRHAEHQPVVADAVTLVSLGFPQALSSKVQVIEPPAIAISGQLGVGSHGSSPAFLFIPMNHDGSVSFQQILGKHNLSLGVEYKKDYENAGQQSYPAGQYTFDATATSSTTYANNGYSYASYLMGMGNPTEGSSNFTQDPVLAESSRYFATYIEDTFRATNKLTIVAGLRWEIFGGRNERHNRLEYFDPTATYTVNGVALKGGEVFARGGNSPFLANLTDFGPRLGLAYRATNSFVLHAGAGIFHGPSARADGLPQSNSDSFSSHTGWNAATLDQYGNSVMVNPLHNPFPNGLTVPSAGSLGLATNLGTSLSTVPHSFQDAEAYNWNAGVQYALSHGMIIYLDYAGSRGLHLPDASGGGGPPLNQLSLEQIAQYGSQLGTPVANPYISVISDPTSAFYQKATIPFWQAVAPFPQFASGSPGGGVSYNSLPLYDTHYNAGSFRFEKRFTSHLSSQASFGWTKTMSDGSRGGFFYVQDSVGYQDWHDLKLERSVDGQDVGKMFNWANLYQLPIGPGRAINPGSRIANWILGGWAVNNILTFSSGVPVASHGTFPNQSIYFSQRPNLTCNPAANAPHTAAQWFLPTCFAAPASPYVAGTSPRFLSSVRADGIHNLDFSLVKTTQLLHETSLELRVDLFNVTNSVQLGLPNSTWNPNNLSGFGKITAAVSSPRQVQFGMRYQF